MWISDIRPETIALLDTMAGRTPGGSWVAGEPVDVSWIDPLALGDLWVAAHGTETWRDRQELRTPAADAARAVLKLGEKMEPLFPRPEPNERRRGPPAAARDTHGNAPASLCAAASNCRMKASA